MWFLGAMRFGIFILIILAALVWFLIVRYYAKRAERIDKSFEVITKPFVDYEKNKNTHEKAEEVN